MYYSSDTEQYKICFIQRYKSSYGRLKKVYGAVDEGTALYELENFVAKWDTKYPKIPASWQAHWAELSTYFKYPRSRSERLSTRRMQLKISTVSCVRLPRAKWYFRTLTDC